LVLGVLVLQSMQTVQQVVQAFMEWFLQVAGAVVGHLILQVEAEAEQQLLGLVTQQYLTQAHPL
jgi:hypothetical protein